MKRFNGIKKIYQAAVDGVRPAALIQKHVSYDGGIAHVGGGKLTIGNNCHVVGTCLLGMIFFFGTINYFHCPISQVLAKLF